jgi:hypothetical protein
VGEFIGLLKHSLSSPLFTAVFDRCPSASSACFLWLHLLRSYNEACHFKSEVTKRNGKGVGLPQWCAHSQNLFFLCGIVYLLPVQICLLFECIVESDIQVGDCCEQTYYIETITIYYSCLNVFLK